MSVNNVGMGSAWLMCYWGESDACCVKAEQSQNGDTMWLPNEVHPY